MMGSIAMKPMTSDPALLLITIALSLLAQPDSLDHTALALHHHSNDSALHTKNGSFLVGKPNSNSTKASLPNPSNCDTPLTHTLMDSSLFENTTMDELFYLAESLAENVSNGQPSTLTLGVDHAARSANATVSLDNARANTTNPCIKSSPSGEEHQSLNQHMANANSHKKESNLDSMDLSIDVQDLWVQMRTDTPPPALNTPINTAAPISSAKESMQVMVISGDDDDVDFINYAQLRTTTPPPSVNAPIHTADPTSMAREPVQVMVIDGDNVVLLNEEHLGGSTKTPTKTPIDATRDSLQVTVIHEHDASFKHRRRRLRSPTPPPGMDTPIHTAARSSVATDQSMQVMVIDDDIDDDEVIIIDNTRLSGATPPPDTVSPIHTAASSSAARESMQVTVMDDGTVVMNIDEEQFRVVTPPPGSATPIHTAASRSVAHNSGMQVMVISDDGADNDSDAVLMHDAP